MASGGEGPRVAAVSRDGAHGFSKAVVPEVVLVAGWGVEGDAHAGTTVQHRSRVARDPTQPNLRQVHLLHAELLAELAEGGFAVGPGELGENVTTAGLDLLGLPTGTLLHLGDAAVVSLTGLRNPCVQIDAFRPGLLRRVVGRAADGGVERRGGVMSIVLAGGAVRAGDPIGLTLPTGERTALVPV